MARASEEQSAESETTIRKDTYDTYLRQRELLDANLMALSDRYSKTLITLAGGALGITITFLEKIAVHRTIELLAVLGLGWLTLLVCIVIELFVIHYGQEALIVSICDNERAYQNYLNSLDGKSEPVPLETALAQSLGRRIERLSLVGLWSLVVGLVLLCVFSATSVWRANLPADSSTTAPSPSTSTPHR